MGARGKLPKQPLPVMYENSANMKRYRAEDALRDIKRVEGHKRDAELMKHTLKLLQKRK